MAKSKMKGIEVLGPAKRGDALEKEKKGFKKGKAAYHVKVNKKPMHKV